MRIGTRLAAVGMVGIMLCWAAYGETIELRAERDLLASVNQARRAQGLSPLRWDESLAAAARERLERLGFSNVRIVEGDGSLGWLAAAPYDAILVTAAAPAVPKPLVDQLAEGGRMAIPVGGANHQDLLRIVKRDGRTTERSLYTCRFVPLIGRYGWPQDSQEANRE